MEKIRNCVAVIVLIMFFGMLAFFGFLVYDSVIVSKEERLKYEIETAQYFTQNRTDIFKNINNLYINGDASSAFDLADKYYYIDDIEIRTLRDDLLEELLLKRLKELPFDNGPIKNLAYERFYISSELVRIRPDNVNYKNINEAAYQDKLRYREKMSTSSL